jgi:4-hydroxybenzoate polyprenyltransferase
VAIGLSMTLLQLSIGVTNDIVDAPRDAGRKPGKPIPAGLVGVTAAQLAALTLFILGGALAGGVADALVPLAVAVVGIGFAYNYRFKGTPWSWLPFAIGIPILPVYGWLGATGGLDGWFAVLVPATVAAGAALAIGNALVDVERDAAAGVTSVALRIGEAGAIRIATALLAAIALAAVVSAATAGASSADLVALTAVGAVPVAAALASAGRSSHAREWAWRAEAVGLAVLAIGWIRAVLP